jgi:hypothetical protein
VEKEDKLMNEARNKMHSCRRPKKIGGERRNGKEGRTILPAHEQAALAQQDAD